jgi:ADP-L-glycero-D-manno-heptose 6-epimerase
MIVVTGAGGFIGSCLISYLNYKSYNDIIAVDSESKRSHSNLIAKRFDKFIDRNEFIRWFENNSSSVSFVFHIGARTDTAEQSETLFDELNVNYSKNIWNLCTLHNIPLIYASSAATYGNGSLGYSDDHLLIPKLKPLNPYGWSKQKMDVWVLEQNQVPDRWAGFKFFNVFGPNEYHKGRMASVIINAFKQIKTNGFVRLFKSNNPSIADGNQKRDFIYVMDLMKVLYYFFEGKMANGIYNLGSGEAHTFLDLTHHVFSALDLQAEIQFIPMPEDLNASYQNYTCADMDKLRKAGYETPMFEFEQSVKDYVKEYLSSNKYY